MAILLVFQVQILTLLVITLNLLLYIVLPLLILFEMSYILSLRVICFQRGDNLFTRCFIHILHHIGCNTL